MLFAVMKRYLKSFFLQHQVRIRRQNQFQDQLEEQLGEIMDRYAGSRLFYSNMRDIHQTLVEAGDFEEGRTNN